MRNRVITAILILGTLIPIIFISTLSFKILAFVLVLATTYEFLNLKKEKKYAITSKLMIYIVNILPLLFLSDFTHISGTYVALILLIFCSLIIIDKNIDYRELAYISLFSSFIIIASLSAIYLRNQENGFYLIIFAILMSAASDTGGFFVGNAIGKTKLIPRLSPKKTVEGLFGGVLFSIIVGVIFSILLPSVFSNTLYVILISGLLGLSAAFGDLFFSSMKRSFNVKDFSNFLPGHGGLLDRVDSHLMNFIVLFIILTIVRG